MDFMCLRLQLERQGRQNTLNIASSTNSWRPSANAASSRLPAAPGNRWTRQAALARIAKLEPRPGRAYLPDDDHYILPEVFRRKSGDDYQVTTNNEHVPHLRISNTYKDLMAQREIPPKCGITSARKSAPESF